MTWKKGEEECRGVEVPPSSQSLAPHPRNPTVTHNPEPQANCNTILHEINKRHGSLYRFWLLTGVSNDDILKEVSVRHFIFY